MKANSAVKIGASVLMLAAGLTLLITWLMPARAAADQDVSCWLCTDPACGKEFTKDVLELARLRLGNPDANPACPHCGKATTIRAVPCPYCGKYLKPLSHGRLPQSCPVCNKAIVPEASTTAPPPAAPKPEAQPTGK